MRVTQVRVGNMGGENVELCKCDIQAEASKAVGTWV